MVSRNVNLLTRNVEWILVLGTGKLQFLHVWLGSDRRGRTAECSEMNVRAAEVLRSSRWPGCTAPVYLLPEALPCQIHTLSQSHTESTQGGRETFKIWELSAILNICICECAVYVQVVTEKQKYCETLKEKMQSSCSTASRHIKHSDWCGFSLVV